MALPYAPDELVWVIGVNKAGCVSIAGGREHNFWSERLNRPNEALIRRVYPVRSIAECFVSDACAE